MATNLYEMLGIARNATPEEVRRAYRRKALETHPDRLPQGAPATQKSASEDLFRKVNNAYEVLCDPQSRAAYDEHGVWPPPSPTSQGRSANGPFSDPFFHDPFSRDPFFRGPRMNPFGGFGFGPRPGPRGFTDPFVLFNSIFGDIHRAFETDPFFHDPFGRPGFESNAFGGGLFNGAFPSMLPSPFDFNGRGMGNSRMQVSSNGRTGGRWVSESWTSSTVNGVTHTKCVRKDSQGNEHVVYRFPDGTERRTINGVEQSASSPPRALPPIAPPAPPVPYPTQGASQPPPPYSEAVAQPPYRSRSSRHHVHYDDHSGDRHEHGRHRHEHSSQDGRGDRNDRRNNDAQSGSPQDGRGGRNDGQNNDAQNGTSWKYWRS